MGRRTFGGVRRKASGRWQAYYTGPDGRRHYGPDTYSTREDAEDYLADERVRIKQGKWVAGKAGAESLESYATRWLKRRDDLKSRTAELYASQLDNHILPVLGRYPLRSITPETVQHWHTGMVSAFRAAAKQRDLERQAAAKAGKRPPRALSDGATAAAQSYRLLRAILNQAVREGAIPESPCKVRGAGIAKNPERLPPTIHEVRAIADAVPDRYRVMVLVAAWCGLRFAELTALTRADVDMSGAVPLVSVSKAANRVGGKVLVEEPKTEAGRRLVHVPPHLAADLADHLERFVSAPGSALVFGTKSGSYLSRTNWSATFGRARLTVGRPDLHFHDLRHLGATMAAQAGATQRELQARIGHATPDAAQRYQHAAAERDAALARALSDAIADGGNVIPLRPRAVNS